MVVDASVIKRSHHFNSVLFSYYSLEQLPYNLEYESLTEHGSFVNWTEKTFRGVNVSTDKPLNFTVGEI